MPDNEDFKIHAARRGEGTAEEERALQKTWVDLENCWNM